MKFKLPRPLWALGLVIFSFGVLFYFSGQSLEKSDSISSGFTQNIIESESVQSVIDTERFEVDQDLWDTFHIFLRKSAHFCLFFLYGFGWVALLCHKNMKKGILLTFLISFLTGAANEYHQYLGGTRTAKITDVMIDTAGGITGALAYAILLFLIQKYWKKSKSTAICE
ncbi:MAG: VanZ family protein [Eubacteriales bacterium]